MKKIVLIISAFLVLSSCGNESKEGETNTSLSAEELNGPELEINVISFSLEKGKTEVKVINRTDADINSLSGRLIFLDENDAPITSATGRQMDSPFQKVENPYIVKAKSTAQLTLSNSIHEGTHSIRIEDLAWKIVSE